MPRHAAYVMLIVIVLGLGAADFLIITSSAGVTRLARAELQEVFGDTLRFDDLHASLDGVLRFRNLNLRLPETYLEILQAEEARLELVRRGVDVYVKSVRLRNPKFTVRDSLIDEISKGTEGRSLRSVLDPGLLPAVEAEGGTFEVFFEDIVRGPAPEVFQIDTMVMLPMHEYGYMVSGRLKSRALGTWMVNGEMDLDSGAVHLVVSSPRLQFTPEVRALLTDKVRENWDNWKPEGLAAVYIRVDSDGKSPPTMTATLTPEDLSITYKNFPYRVEHLQGEIDFTTEGLVIKRLSGRRGETLARATGRANGYGPEAGFQIRLEVDRMPVNDELLGALGEEERKIVELFSPEGEVSLRAAIRRGEGPDEKVKVPLELTLHGVTFRFADFPYEVRHADGWIAVDGGDINVRGIRAHDRGADVRIEGTIQDIAHDPEIDLRIEARNLTLDYRLKQALGKKMHGVWDDFSPEGVLDVTWRVRRKPGEEVVHHGMFHSRGGDNKCTYRKVPILMTGVRGMVEYTPEKVILHHLAAKGSGAEIELHGEIVDGENITLRFNVSGLKVNETFIRNTPGVVQKILKKVRLRGESNFGMDLKIRSKSTRYTLDLLLNRATIQAAVPFEEVQGTVSLIGNIVGERSEVLGHVNFARAKIAGKSASDLLASLNMSDSMLRFGSIKTSAYGGVITGSFFVDTESGEYGGEFAADRVDLREYSRETESFREKAILGKVSLEIKELQGKGTDLGTMTGKGSLIIRDGFLWEVPLFVDLWTINPQKMFQKRNVFDAGNVKFKINKNRFLLREIAFTSEDVSVLGAGKIGFDGQLDLVLRAHSGSLLGIKIPGLDLLLSPLDLLKGAFLGVRLTGTFEKPESSVEMFPGSGVIDEDDE